MQCCVRCVVVRGEAWPELLSPYNTCSVATFVFITAISGGNGTVNDCFLARSDTVIPTPSAAFATHGVCAYPKVPEPIGNIHALFEHSFSLRSTRAQFESYRKETVEETNQTHRIVYIYINTDTRRDREKHGNSDGE